VSAKNSAMPQQDPRSFISKSPLELGVSNRRSKGEEELETDQEFIKSVTQRGNFIFFLQDRSKTLSSFYIYLVRFIYGGEMPQIDPIHPSLTSPTAYPSEPKTADRLIVLVPQLEWDHIPAIHRIWDLANSQQARVLLISLCKDPSQEPSFRRALIILCAMVQDGRIPVDMHVEIGTNWVDVVKRNAQQDDMIICFAEQRVGLLQKPLSQLLESKLTIPIYIVSGVRISRPKSSWLALVSMWFGSFAIIAGFGLLQVKIMQVSEDWFQTILLILVVIFEIWLIWIWDSWFR
jgi:hypothetical protein